MAESLAHMLCPDYADIFQLELLYSLLNKRTSRHTKLPTDVFGSCSKVFGVADDDLESVLMGGREDEAE